MTVKKTNLVTKVLLFSVFLALIVLYGCSDEQTQMKIAKLNAENEMLKMEADSLEKAILVKKSEEDSIKKHLQSLDMGI